MTCSRRDFLSVSMLALAAGAFPRGLVAGGRDAVALEEIRRNVGVFSSRGGTIGWLASGAGAAVVDSQFPDTARVCADALDARGGLPLRALINTHHHGDHTAGNGVFREFARRIVAHARVPELQRRAAGENGADQVYADTTFEREWTVGIGNETVRAKHYGPAHTGGDSTVFFERADVVHMGDLIFNRAYPFIDLAGGASVEGWIEVLEAVAAEHTADTIFVFGHGNPEFGVTGGRADVLLQRDFLSAVLDAARRAIAEGKSREEATEMERLPGFDDHVAIADWLTLSAPLGAAYDELTDAR